MSSIVAKDRSFTDTEQVYIDNFTEVDVNRPLSSWFTPLRKHAMSEFIKYGLPHRGYEDWHWTDLRQKLKGKYPSNISRKLELIVAKEILQERVFSNVDRHLAVFVNGVFCAELSDLAGLETSFEMLTFKEAIARSPGWFKKHLPNYEITNSDGLIAINTAYVCDGAVLYIHNNTILEKPVELCCINTQSEVVTYNIRNFIMLASNSRATILQSYYGLNGSSYINNIINDIILDDTAKLTLYRAQDDSKNAVHLSHSFATLGEDSEYKSYILATGANLCSIRDKIIAKRPNNRASVLGLVNIADEQHCDINLKIEHQASNCFSEQYFKSILSDKAKSIFQGSIIVDKNAVDTNAHQLARGLLLSDFAEFNVKPELKIFVDAVKCSHGSTCGAIDEQHLFYLMARGIKKEVAEKMLINAFMSEIFDKMPDANIANNMQNYLFSGDEIDV